MNDHDLMQTMRPNPLGRIHIPDERDAEYPLRPQATTPMDEKALVRGWRYWWPDGWWGDQALTSECVAYAWTAWAEDGPITHRPLEPQRDAVHGQGKALVDPHEVYVEAQKNDYWPGEDYDGTSVRAGAQVLRRLGIIREFRWVWTVDDLAMAILAEAPAVVGTIWTQDMFRPDAGGQVHPTGQVVGGHAYKVDGVNLREEMFRFKNSWGRAWGKRGFGYISFADMEYLLAEAGEACIAIELETA